MNHRSISYTVAQFVFINHAAISLFDLTESDASNWAGNLNDEVSLESKNIYGAIKSLNISHFPPVLPPPKKNTNNFKEKVRSEHI